MTDRLRSGHARLDEILHGGLPANGINLVIGTPGAGKTILAEQYVFHNATKERPALYLSTVSEPFDKLLRYGQSLRFFDTRAVGDRVLFEDLGATLNARGLAGVIEQTDKLIKEVRPGFLVIDSFKALRAFASDQSEYRRFLHDLAGRLTALAISSFWVGEYDANAAADAPEFAVADSIIALSVERKGERQIRLLAVLKLRGSGFAAGQHAFRITAAGLDVYPRLADLLETSAYSLPLERHSSGVRALDELLSEGYWRGSVTLVCGPSGVGKTLMGLHFVYAGTAKGEPGVIATLQENPTQLARIVQGFGWSLDNPLVHVHSRSPVDMRIDEWVYDLLDLVAQTGSKRVLIDSLGDLLATTGDPLRFREWMYSLAQRFSRAGVSLFMTYEVPELFELTRVSEAGLSHLADNVVLLQYLQLDSTLHRALTVLKTRASRHDPVVRTYEILPEGIVLGPTPGELAKQMSSGIPITANRSPQED